MKKQSIFAVIMILIILSCTLVISACNISPSMSTLYKTGIEMACLLEEMIDNSDYLEIQEISSDSIKKYYGNDYDNPSKAYIIQPPTSSRLVELIKIDYADELANIPNHLREQLTYLLDLKYVVLRDILTKDVDFDDVVICNTLIATKNIKGNLGNDVAYVYVFNTGVPIIVYYHQQAKNSIAILSHFLLPESLSNTLELFDKYECKVTEYN